MIPCSRREPLARVEAFAEEFTFPVEAFELNRNRKIYKDWELVLATWANTLMKTSNRSSRLGKEILISLEDLLELALSTYMALAKSISL